MMRQRKNMKDKKPTKVISKRAKLKNSSKSLKTVQTQTRLPSKTTTEKKVQVYQGLRLKWTKYIPSEKVPTLRQKAFLLLNDEDILFGGAAGGGKSEALLMAALQYVDIPGYHALILRRTFMDLSLPEAIMSRAIDWLYDTDAKWNQQLHEFKFPSGATLTFGYLDTPLDHLRYKSAEFQFIGFDEASDMRWSQINYMFSRFRRKAGSTIPLRYRLCTNPGGVSHEEIKAKYIEPKTREAGTIFIASKLSDNPHLDQSYSEQLAKLDPVERARLMNGDWDVTEKGNMFTREKFTLVDGYPRQCKFIRWWDLAATEPNSGNKDPDWTAGVLLGHLKGSIYICDMRRIRKAPGPVEKLIIQTALIDQKGHKNITLWFEEEGGSSGKAAARTLRNNLREQVPGVVVRSERTTGDKIANARSWSAFADNENVYLVKGSWNKDFLDEHEVFPNKDYHDDQVDATGKAYRKAVRRGMGWSK